MNPRRLYRSHDRMLAGVAGGMAEYLDLDPTIIRIGWIIVALASAGMALIAYILLAIVIPTAPSAAPVWPWPAPPPNAWPGQPAAPATVASAPPAAPASPPWYPQAPAWTPPPPRPSSRGLGIAAISGVVLVVIGVIALADVVLPGIHTGRVIGPAAILALGAALLVASVRRQPQDVPALSGPPPVAGDAVRAAGGSSAPEPGAAVEAPSAPVEEPPAAPPEPSETAALDADDPRT